MGNEFSEKMATLSDRSLAEIIRFKDNYDPNAVLAAQAELDARQVPAKTIAQLGAEVKEDKAKKLEQVIDSTLSGTSNKISAWFAKSKFNEGKGSRIVFALVILHFLWFLYTLFPIVMLFGMAGFTISGPYFKEVAIALFDPLFLGLITLFLFRKRMFGWYLAVVNSSLALVTTVGYAIYASFFASHYIPISMKFMESAAMMIMVRGAVLYMLLLPEVRTFLRANKLVLPDEPKHMDDILDSGL